MEEEIMKVYRSLSLEVLRLRKIGLVAESVALEDVLKSIEAYSGIEIPDFFKKDRAATREIVMKIYAFSGRKDGRITKKNIRDYVKRVLHKSEVIATKYITDKPGHMLYRAIMFGFLKEGEGEDIWKVVNTVY